MKELLKENLKGQIKAVTWLTLLELAKEYPNDQEFGTELRKLLNELK